jgi:predicted nuclease of predicted toxin-antitoxin system
MKILCDVHISIKVAKFFAGKGCEAVHVNNILDKWFTTDNKISEFADLNDFVLITKDSDFKNTHFINRFPKKLIKINLGNISTHDLVDIFEKSFQTIEMEFGNNSFCYVEINKDYLLIISDSGNRTIS